MKNRTFWIVILLFIFNGLSYAQGTWTQKTDFGGGHRQTAVGFSIGTKGYIGTGYDDSAQVNKNDFWEWDQGTDVWTQKANFPGAARQFAVGFSIGSEGYIGTGEDAAGHSYRDFWEYNPAANLWTQKALVGGLARNCAVAFSVGTKAYITSGIDSIAYNHDLWEWDQATNMWTQKVNFPGAGRVAAVGFSIGTKGYVGTGYIGNFRDTNDFWEYNPATNSWIQKANFAGGIRDGAVGFSIGNKGYIGTGENADQFSLYIFNDMWEYNPSTDTWIQKTSNTNSGYGRVDAVGFSIGTKGYIGTGVFANNEKDFWEFDPTVTGINEQNIENSISIYPNPFSSETTLKIGKSLKDAMLTIYNSSGQEVNRINNISGEEIKLQRNNLAAGIYFIELTQDGKIIATNKIIITD